MRMDRQIAVGVLDDIMMFFTGCIRRIDMDGSVGKIVELMQQLMAHGFSDFMSFFDGETLVHCYIQLCMQPMA